MSAFTPANLFRKVFPYLLLFIVYTFIFLYSYSITELPSYEKIPAMDGNQYLKMWEYFKHHGDMDYKVDFPFNGRVLYMWLGSLLPVWMGGFQVFLILNYCFGMAALFLFFHNWNRLSSSLLLSLFLCLYLCVHWSGIIRQYIIDPIGVDIPYLFCLAVLLYHIVYEKYKYLFIIAVLGTAVKEAMLPFILFLLIIKIFRKGIVTVSFEKKKMNTDLSKIDPDIWYIFAALVGCVLCKALIGFYFPSIQQGWRINSVVMVAYYFYLIIRDPNHLPNWLTGIVLFIGPMLYPFIKAAFSKQYRTGVSGELLVLSLLGILLGILGGGDHTRIVFLSFPFYFTFILLYWRDAFVPMHWPFYLVPALYLTKCWLYLPTPTVNWETFSYWYPEYSNFRFFLYEWIVVIISGLVLYFYDKTKQRVIPT